MFVKLFNYHNSCLRKRFYNFVEKKRKKAEGVVFQKLLAFQSKSRNDSLHSWPKIPCFI
jgi:hypothetical protein